MAVVRQDAWSPDDDLILAEVTLRQIRDGGTQLKAFEEVGERIGRTAAACGFRWNSYVRKKYETAIQIAKKQRQKRHQLRKKSFSPVTEDMLEASHELVPQDLQISGNESMADEEDILSIDDVIRYLRKWKGEVQDWQRKVRKLEKELKDKEDQVASLTSENEKLNKQVNEVQIDYRTVNDDYRALIQIMDRARKMAFLPDEEDGRAKFKMDANGNLERVE